MANDIPSTFSIFDEPRPLLAGLGDIARGALDEFTDLDDSRIDQIVDAAENLGRAVLPPDQPPPDAPGAPTAPPSSSPFGVPPGPLLVGVALVVLVLVAR